MELNEYQQLAMRTKKQYKQLDEQIVDAGLGLAGEAGEVADIIKKHMAGTKEINKFDLEKELGDILWYIAEMADAFDITMDSVANTNIEKLRMRHGDKFSGYGDRINGWK